MPDRDLSDEQTNDTSHRTDDPQLDPPPGQHRRSTSRPDRASGRRPLHRIFSSFSPQQKRNELDEEIEAHLAMRAADLEARGMDPERARSAALERFGDLDAARRSLAAASKQRDRRITLAEWIDDVRRDVTVALRRMSGAKARTAMMLAIFALGIGLTTTMLTVVDHVLVRPLPFEASHELVELRSVDEQGNEFPYISMGNYYDWRDQNTRLAATGLFRSILVSVTTEDDVVRIDAAEAGGEFFETLRPHMLMGRPATSEDAEAETRTVVLSEEYWRNALGADRGVLGTTLTLDGRPHEVIGVVAEAYTFPEGAQLWTRIRIRPQTGGARNNVNFGTIARLAPGASIAQADDELDAIAHRIRTADPDGIYSFGVGVVPLHEAIVAPSAGNLRILMAAVLLVFLVACVNLMGISFADGRARGEELSVRLALGAGRRRLLQQLVTEHLLLGLVGGALGLLLAVWGTGWIVARAQDVLPRAGEITLDLRVAAAALALSVAAGLLSGLLPAWRSSGRQPGQSLSRTRVVRGGRRLPGASLVVLEIAMTVVLLASGALLLRSLTTLIDRDLGFDARNVATLDVNLWVPSYSQDPGRVTRYWDQLQAALADQPSVEAAAIGTGIPTGSGGTGFISLPGNPDAEIGARYRVVSEGYFETLGTRLLAGRFFDAQDTATSARTVVINRAMADRYWPGESPLGETVKARSMESYWYGGTAPWLTVIGIVDDMRQYGFEDDLEPAMFTLYRQIPQMAYEPAAVVRMRPGALSGGSATETLRQLRDVARSVDGSLSVQTGVLEGRVFEMLSERRLVVGILVGFAVFALILASLGIYAMLAFAVQSRTPELAIRAVLGAGRREQVGLILRAAAAVVGLGALLGGIGVFGAQRLVQSMLVDVSPTDPVALVAVGVVLLGVTVVAVLVPALRAARLDPNEALRRA